MAGVDAVILAAGRSERMGQPKHLIRFRDRSLLAHVVEAVRNSHAREVVVVLRPGDSRGRSLADQLGVRAVEAEDPEEGRAASIRAGVRALPNDADGVLFVLADQPLLLAEDFDALIARFSMDEAPIVYATYSGDQGTPVLFAAAYRRELESLRGEEGGQNVLRRHPQSSVGLPLPPERGRDFDCPEDLLPLR
jgi:molybdenum cofactor cytidylyltransferase